MHPTFDLITKNICVVHDSLDKTIRRTRNPNGTIREYQSEILTDWLHRMQKTRLQFVRKQPAPNGLDRITRFGPYLFLFQIRPIFFFLPKYALPDFKDNGCSGKCAFQTTMVCIIIRLTHNHGIGNISLDTTMQLVQSSNRLLHYPILIVVAKPFKVNSSYIDCFVYIELQQLIQSFL